MDNLKNLWANLDPSFEGPEITKMQINLKSRVEMPLEKLRSNVRLNLAMGFICMIILGAVFVIFDGFWARVLLGIILFGYIGFIWQTIYLYRRYLQNLYPENDIKSYLKTLHYSLKAGLRYQELIAIFFYPVSLAAGFLLSLYEQGEIETLFSNPFLWGTLIAIIILITPLFYLLSRWLYKITFDKYLDQIEVVLNELKEDNSDEN